MDGGIILKLDNLKSLYSFMKKNKIDRYQFQFNFRGKIFDVLYFIDEEPNILAFGVANHNFYFEIEVKSGFIIKAFIDDYSAFVKMMGFSYSEDNKFKPSIFFEELNTYLPNVPRNIKNTPKPHEIAIYRSNVEEMEKIYFVGWLNHKEGSGNSVRPENLEKTKMLLSNKAYVTCKEKNVSSRWSPHPTDAKEYFEPPEKH